MQYFQKCRPGVTEVFFKKREFRDEFVKQKDYNVKLVGFLIPKFSSILYVHLNISNSNYAC